MKQTQKKLERGRRVHYGTLAVALTVLVLAALIVFNAIFTGFAAKKNWTLDLTKENVFGLSDKGREIIETVDTNVNIIFCAPFDQLEANSSMKMIYELVKEVSNANSNITYSYVEPLLNPSSVDVYRTTEAQTIASNYVIIDHTSNEYNEDGSLALDENGEPKLFHEFRIFAAPAFFVTNSDGSAWAFNGEKKLISAIKQVTQIETPIAYFTNTHGETIDSQLVMALYEAGFSVQPIDLTKEDFDPSGRLLVIGDPRYDFQGISPDTVGIKSEIEKIDDFLEGFGNLFVYCDPASQALPELEEYLIEWGIQFDHTIVKDPDSSLDVANLALVTTYAKYQESEDAEGENTAAASLVHTIESMSNPPKTVVRNAQPINLLWDYHDRRSTGTVLYTSDGAKKYDLNGQLTDEGKFSVMTLSTESRTIDNVAHTAYVLAVGSKYFASSDYIGSSTYGNSDILNNFFIKTTLKQVSLDLDFKPFDTEELVITTKQANTWTICLTLILPSCALVCGIVVWLRRKHA